MNVNTAQSRIEDTHAVRLGVIGAGFIGMKHAGIVAGLPGCRLVGVSDPNPAARKVAEDLGTRYFDDFEEMIRAEQPEGVIIATPTEHHASVGIACAKYGVHLMVEKPIASNLEAAQDLIAEARKRDVQLMVGHHRRFSPLVEMARQVVRSGQLGRMVAVSVLWTLLKPADYFDIDWHRKKGAGPLLTNLIHDIDNLRYICGDIQRVYAEISHAGRGFEVEDTACVSLRFASGVLGTVTISDCVPSQWSYEATTGENPFFSRTREDCYLFFGMAGSLAFPTMRLVRYASPATSGWQFPLQTEQITVQAEDPLLRQIMHFRAVIRGKEKPRTNGEDALRSLAVVQAVGESGHSGQSVTLTPESHLPL